MVLRATVRQRRAEVERWIREAEGALAPCRQALGAEGGPLGRAGAAVEEAGRPVKLHFPQHDIVLSHSVERKLVSVFISIPKKVDTLYICRCIVVVL